MRASAIIARGVNVPQAKRYLGCHPDADLILVDAYEVNTNDYRACVRCSACWRECYIALTRHQYRSLQFDPKELS